MGLIRALYRAYRNLMGVAKPMVSAGSKNAGAGAMVKCRAYSGFHLHIRWWAISVPPPLWGRIQVGGDLRVLPPILTFPHQGGRDLLNCKSL
jgi:hypothetical protein